MKRVYRDGGFWLCFLINLMLRFEWALLAVAALVLHFAIGLTMTVFWILLGVWVMVTFAITAVLSWASAGQKSTPSKKNVNPYSKSTTELLPRDGD